MITTRIEQLAKLEPKKMAKAVAKMMVCDDYCDYCAYEPEKWRTGFCSGKCKKGIKTHLLTNIVIEEPPHD